MNKQIDEIENELSKYKEEFYKTNYVPPPTVDAAVESITLVGESLYSWQTPIFVQAVIDGLQVWLEETQAREDKALVSYFEETP